MVKFSFLLPGKFDEIKAFCGGVLYSTYRVPLKRKTKNPVQKGVRFNILVGVIKGCQEYCRCKNSKNYACFSELSDNLASFLSAICIINLFSHPA